MMKEGACAEQLRLIKVACRGNFASCRGDYSLQGWFSVKFAGVIKG